MRSLMLPPGLRYSTLAATSPEPGGVTEPSLTSGVLPISSVMVSAICMPASWHGSRRDGTAGWGPIEEVILGEATLTS